MTFSRAAYIFLREAYIFLREAYIFLREACIFSRAAVTFHTSYFLPPPSYLNKVSLCLQFSFCHVYIYGCLNLKTPHPCRPCRSWLQLCRLARHKKLGVGWATWVGCFLLSLSYARTRRKLFLKIFRSKSITFKTFMYLCPLNTG